MGLVDVIIKVDETGKITDLRAGINKLVEEGFHYCFTGIPMEHVPSYFGGQLVIENFKLRVIPADGVELPETPPPPLTLAQKVEVLEKELTEQKEMNVEFQNATNVTFDFIFSKPI